MKVVNLEAWISTPTKSTLLNFLLSSKLLVFNFYLLVFSPSFPILPRYCSGITLVQPITIL